MDVTTYDVTTYLLAKYVPDSRRNEPRNVGVVVWSPEGMAARFLGEKRDHPGEVDLLAVPTFVRSPENYAEWVRHWRKAIEKPELYPRRGIAGPPQAVPRCSPGFLEVLKEGDRLMYYLAGGATLCRRTRREDLPHLTEILFLSLVEGGPYAPDILMA